MSRAFITDKEDWVYCAKAGERCMHAEEGKACTETSCEFFHRAAKAPSHAATQLKVVRRKPKDAKASSNAKASSKVTSEPRRKTKKSTLQKPVKWGGRSASGK